MQLDVESSGGQLVGDHLAELHLLRAIGLHDVPQGQVTRHHAGIGEHLLGRRRIVGHRVLFEQTTDGIEEGLIRLVLRPDAPGRNRGALVREVHDRLPIDQVGDRPPDLRLVERRRRVLDHQRARAGVRPGVWGLQRPGPDVRIATGHLQERTGREDADWGHVQFIRGEGQRDVGLGADIEELDRLRARRAFEDLGAPPVVTCLVGHRVLAGVDQPVRPGPDWVGVA